MKTTKKMAGMIAAVTVICALGNGLALAAEPVKSVEAKPAAVSQLGSFIIRICDKLGNIAVCQDTQTADISACNTNAAASFDVSYEVTEGSEAANDTKIVLEQPDALTSDYVVSVTLTQEQDGKTLISKDGGKTWEEVQLPSKLEME